jgi:hypothetical protein
MCKDDVRGLRDEAARVECLATACATETNFFGIDERFRFAWKLGSGLATAFRQTSTAENFELDVDLDSQMTKVAEAAHPDFLRR